jgi:Tfp pilus assembly protein FimT
MVIVILGILGTIAVPQFHSMMGARRLNAASGELVSALQYARNLAVKHQRPFGLNANLGGNWFRVYDDQYKTDNSPHHDEVPPVDANGVVLNPLDKTWYVIDYDTMDTYEGVTMTSIPSSNRVCFYPDGHSSSSDSTFVLSYTGAQRTITVNGTTGRIHVQ